MTELRLGRTYWFLQNIQAVAGGIVALVAAHWLAPTAAPLLAVWLIAWLFNAWLAGFDTSSIRRAPY